MSWNIRSEVKGERMAFSEPEHLMKLYLVLQTCDVLRGGKNLPGSFSPTAVLSNLTDCRIPDCSELQKIDAVK